MLTLTQQEHEIVKQFKRLPPERQRRVMLAMFNTDPARWGKYQAQGEQQLRKLAADRGLDWAKLNDEQRQDFVNELLHEERP